MGDINLKSLCVKLKYKFRNIVLLHEALTHSFGESEENKYFSPYPGVLYKQKDYRRLHTLGIRVLEHLIVEQAVNQFAHQELTGVTLKQDEKSARREFWSFKAELQNPKYFEAVGEQLSLREFIKMTSDLKSRVETLHEPVVKAILGAVFIDSGGCYGRLGSKSNPLRETRNVFLHLWGLAQFDENHICQIFEAASLEKPSQKCKSGVLEKRIYDLSRKGGHDTKLGYKFQQNWILCQALAGHNNGNQAFEILKAVGDSVWELVICEYLYWFFVNDDHLAHFSDEKIGLYCKHEFQEAIVKGINLEDDLKLEKAGEKALLHIYLKSLVGGIFVDSGSSLSSAKKSIVHLCEDNRHQVAKKMQRPLPHSCKTYRGSYYHIMDKFCCIVDHGPPKRQESFKITNVSDFMKVMDSCEYEVKANHVDEMAVAKKEEELDYRRIFTSSEDVCNQMEYERVSLYRTLERMRSDFISPNGDVVNIQHTYGKCLCEGEGVTPDCCEVPQVTHPLSLTTGYGTASNPKVMEAVAIVCVWILMWMQAILKKVNWLLAVAWKLSFKLYSVGTIAIVVLLLIRLWREGVVWVRTWLVEDTGHEN